MPSLRDEFSLLFQYTIKSSFSLYSNKSKRKEYWVRKRISQAAPKVSKNDFLEGGKN